MTMTAERLAVGDVVRVFSPRQRRRDDGPQEGREARVTKVARKYATAEYDLDRYAQVIEFDIETGRERGSEGSYSRYVLTPAQVDARNQYAEAIGTLKEAGLEPRPGRRVDAGLAIALAALARSFDPDTSTPKENDR